MGSSTFLSFLFISILIKTMSIRRMVLTCCCGTLVIGAGALAVVLNACLQGGPNPRSLLRVLWEDCIQGKGHTPDLEAVEDERTTPSIPEYPESQWNGSDGTNDPRLLRDLQSAIQH